MTNNKSDKVAPYSGKVTLNARNITSASESLTGRIRNQENLKGAPMSLGELIGVLSFIESCVMSDHIYFDGTLPPRDVEKLQEDVQGMRKQAKDIIGTDRMLSIDSIGVQNPGQLVSLCKQAAEQSSELIAGIELGRLDKSEYDRPLAASEAKDVVESFEREVSGAYASVAGRVREAEEIASDIVEGKMTFRGSKCVIGLLTAQCDEFDLLSDVSMKFRSCSTELKHYLVPALINRFRINYLGGLSATRQAPYLADPGIEGLRTDHNRLLWRY